MFLVHAAVTRTFRCLLSVCYFHAPQLESILSRYPGLCVAVVDVEFDDYLGVCSEGRPFARLTTLQKTARRFEVTAKFYVDLKRR